jgi:hypothetical protein
MRISFRRTYCIAMATTASLLTGTVPVVMAQGRTADGELEELVVTGTRAAARSVTESAVPIDVLAGRTSRIRPGRT